MEWVEFTAATIDEATSLAVAQLGVAVESLEVDVLEEPVPGLFGRVRGAARIRARVAGAKPKRAASKKAGKADKSVAQPGEKPSKEPASSLTTQSSGSRKGLPKASGSALAAVAAVADADARAPKSARGGAGRTEGRRVSVQRTPQGGNSRPPRDHDVPVDVEAVVTSATRFLEGLLDAAGLDGDVSSRVVDEQTVEMAMVGEGLGMLVGPKGATLLATQELLRSFVHHDTGGRSGRLMLDVAGYREKRRTALQAFTKQVAQSVIESGERRVLEPMTAVDRKVVHDTVGEIDGVTSISEGEDPDRYVVLLPA